MPHGAKVVQTTSTFTRRNGRAAALAGLGAAAQLLAVVSAGAMAGVAGSAQAQPACRSAIFAERALCRDDGLYFPDMALNAAYRDARSIGDDPALLAGQRAWLATRNACRTIVCVRRQYTTRLGQLSAYIAVHGGGSPAGFYVKHRFGEGVMSIRRSGQTWSVHVNAGGIPNGGATTSDCEITAVGTMSGRTFSGTFDADNGSPAPLTVTFRGDTAQVAGDTGLYCPRNDGIGGVYHLTR